MAIDIGESRPETSAVRHHSLSPSDRRDFIPVLGLKEYWYPALSDSEVGGKKPVLLKLLGEDICFFRGTDGKVAALTNVCPHRGAQLALGSCDFKGTVSCPYHGFVFDQTGECLAALGEGPDSKMPGKIRARVYPTRTLKGLVFVWMGDEEPAGIEDDVPEEFFDENALVMHSTSIWKCNWRPAVENLYDAHVSYVHRDALLTLMRPFGGGRMAWRRPVQIGGSLQQQFGFGGGGAGGQARNGAVAGRPAQAESYRRFYPQLNAYWPKHNYRKAWSWLFALRRRGRGRAIEFKSPEWRAGHHLPSTISIGYGTHMYRRICVPIDETTTRVFYYHYAMPNPGLGRAYEIAFYRLIHSYLMNKNFSGQDYRVVGKQYYDRPEKLSVSDLQSIEWRKMVMRARGMNLASDQVQTVWQEEELAEADATAGQQGRVEVRAEAASAGS